MRLRNQVLTLSLATLLVPWAGWKLVQELEAFLRAGQESALLATARTVAQAVPAEYRESLAGGRAQALPVRELPAAPHIDGYPDDWTGSEQGLEFSSADGVLQLKVMAGLFGGQLYLHCRVADRTRIRERLPQAGAGPARSDGLLLFLRGARGLVGFRVHTAAPGPLNLSSQTEGGGQLEGYWLDLPEGYQVEMALPAAVSLAELSLGAVDVERGRAGQRVMREAGTLRAQRPETWLQVAMPMPGLGDWLADVTPAGDRAWIVDERGWVLASSGVTATPAGRQLTWAERILYRAVAGARTEFTSDRPEDSVRFEEPLVAAALAGGDAQHWGQDPDSAVVRNTVAVPLELQGAVRGAVIMEAATDGLLLVTNRALGRIMLTTLLLTLALAAGLWFFATRLSRRVQRLSGAVSRAMDEAGQPGELPLTSDRDELGELARNNARLLRAVAEYTAYLQKLAGRLSHELKTPLAITRSSLDNLASHELDPEAARYVARAREGLDRQAAIVRAMSEASRLEAAIKATDWVEVDLRELLQHCVEAYRGVNPDRHIGLQLPSRACTLRCAPDLIAQALDKLVDNAISLTGPAEAIDVALEPAEAGCRVRVTNSGTRLPDVLPEQLFDSLVSLREKGGGRHLGLGLHIVRLVAEAHGGRVTARNLDRDRGVEFTLHLAGGAGGHRAAPAGQSG
jgi:dedicated sortase system histidine kinase